MNFFILLMIVSAAAVNLDMLGKTAQLAQTLQETCVDYSPHHSDHTESLNALVCGTSVKNLLIKDIFLTTGLYHLLIVSGSHLQTLIWLLNKNSLRTKWLAQTLKWSLLFAYCLTCGFGAPVIRALVAELLRALSKGFHWHWSPWRVQLVSGFALLSISLDSFSSFSFYLSWLASLGFIFPLPQRSSSIAKHFFICLVISLLMLIPFYYQGPLSLLMNFALGGFLSLWLFPLALLTKVLWLIKIDISKLFDVTFEALLEILEFCKNLGLHQPSKMIFPEMNWKIWSALLFIQLALFMIRQWRYRK